MDSPIHDKRSDKREKVLSGDIIPFLRGRPKRSLVISKDEALDIRIFLNVTHSVDEFLAKI